MSDQSILPFVNPATGERFGQVAVASAAEVQAAVAEMRRAAEVWRGLPIQARVRAVRRLQGAIVDARDEITSVITMDTGKTRQDSLIEVLVAADNVNLACSNAPRWLRRERLPRGLYIFKRFYVEPRPYGVVAVIVPWNYPFLLAAPPMAAALLAGNTVVIKPSEVTGATGALIERLVERVPEIAPFVRVVHGGGEVGEALVRAGPDYIFLTGSVETGRKVMRAAAEQLIPLTCELGGKDAMLVLDDADLDAAAEWGVWGAFFNTGQSCVSVERVYVVDSVHDAYVEKVIAATRRLKQGYSLEANAPHHMGPLAFPRQLEIVQRHLADAVARGARVVTGGQHRDLFHEPTVLLDVTPDMLLMREETFGPLMPIVRVRDEAEAIRCANDSSFGLSAAVWSRNLERAEAVARQLEVGSVIINDTIAHIGVSSVPFGGAKQSGFGRTHGRHGLLQFTQPRAYAVGDPPRDFDLATLMRRPGHYELGTAVLRLAFGATPRQRLEPLVELARGQVRRLGPARVALVLGALATAALALGRKRGDSTLGRR